MTWFDILSCKELEFDQVFASVTERMRLEQYIHNEGRCMNFICMRSDKQKGESMQ